VRLRNNLVVTADTHVVVIETTLFSPWYFVSNASGYDAFVEIRNNSAQTASGVVVTAYRSDGGPAGSTTITVPANGTALVPVSVLSADGFGSVQIAHRGTPEGLAANMTTLSPLTGLSFDSPFTPRMDWIFRP
jgi:hypothetical protein